jgi:hypothetical protein
MRHCFQWLTECFGTLAGGSFVAVMPAYIKTVPVTPG